LHAQELLDARTAASAILLAGQFARIARGFLSGMSEDRREAVHGRAAGLGRSQREIARRAALPRSLPRAAAHVDDPTRSGLRHLRHVVVFTPDDLDRNLELRERVATAFMCQKEDPEAQAYGEMLQQLPDVVGDVVDAVWVRDMMACWCHSLKKSTAANSLRMQVRTAVVHCSGNFLAKACA
jgi:hypothetical protein